MGRFLNFLLVVSFGPALALRLNREKIKRRHEVKYRAAVHHQSLARRLKNISIGTDSIETNSSGTEVVVGSSVTQTSVTEYEHTREPACMVVVFFIKFLLGALHGGATAAHAHGAHATLGQIVHSAYGGMGCAGVAIILDAIVAADAMPEQQINLRRAPWPNIVISPRMMRVRRVPFPEVDEPTLRAQSGMHRSPQASSQRVQTSGYSPGQPKSYIETSSEVETRGFVVDEQKGEVSFDGAQAFADLHSDINELRGALEPFVSTRLQTQVNGFVFNAFDLLLSLSDEGIITDGYGTAVRIKGTLIYLSIEQIKSWLASLFGC